MCACRVVHRSCRMYTTTALSSYDEFFLTRCTLLEGESVPAVSVGWCVTAFRLRRNENVIAATSFVRRRVENFVQYCNTFVRNCGRWHARCCRGTRRLGENDRCPVLLWSPTTHKPLSMLIFSHLSSRRKKETYIYKLTYRPAHYRPHTHAPTAHLITA